MTEHIQPTTRPQTKEVTRPNWSAVFSVAFCVACLITVEFLPVSLLTPMAQDLGISEGVAGQSVTVTAFVAMFASLFITQVIGTIDRRKVVILFSVLLTLSCLLVSFAESHAPGARADGAESAFRYLRCGLHRAGDRRAAGQLPRWDYRLA